MLSTIKNIDLYLLDQILKDRFQKKAVILDAGCGTGRNLKWFYKNNYKVFGVDADKGKIEAIKCKYLNQKDNFTVATLDDLPFETNTFDHVICNAVLHFATSETHFKNMFIELLRVLKPKGMLFIRMTSNIGIENRVKEIRNGVFEIPDGSTRFLLTKIILDTLVKQYKLSFLEPLKTVNVNNLRCMSTLVIQKAE